MTITARDLVEIGAYTMHDCNRIHQTADCLSAGHAPPLNRAEFKSYAELDKYELGLMRDIARAALIATFRKLAEDGPTEAMLAVRVNVFVPDAKLGKRGVGVITTLDADGLKAVCKALASGLLREMEGLTP